MGSVIAWTLGVATLFGGIAALIYFREVWNKKRAWTEMDKQVNTVWWESSDLKKRYEADDYEGFAWSNQDSLAQRLAEGREIVYEIDEKSRVKYKLVNKSGQVLLCRRGNRDI